MTDDFYGVFLDDARIRDMYKIQKMREEYGDRIRFCPYSGILHLEDLEKIPELIYELESILRLYLKNVSKIDISSYTNLIQLNVRGKSSVKEIPSTVTHLVIRDTKEIPSWVSSDTVTRFEIKGFPTADFPDHIDLPNLQNISIKFTKLSSIPRMLVDFPIEGLKITNGLICEVPDWIGEFNSLMILDLKNNPIKRVSSKICELSGLIHLDLSNTQIKSLPDGIGRLKGLELLKVNNTMIKHFSPDLGSIRRFEFDNTPIEELPPIMMQENKIIKLFNSPLKYPLDWKNGIEMLYNNPLIVVPNWWDMEEVYAQCRILGINPRIFIKKDEYLLYGWWDEYVQNAF